jgi:hypothetical protein
MFKQKSSYSNNQCAFVGCLRSHRATDIHVDPLLTVPRCVVQEFGGKPYSNGVTDEVGIKRSSADRNDYATTFWNTEQLDIAYRLVEAPRVCAHHFHPDSVYTDANGVMKLRFNHLLMLPADVKKVADATATLSKRRRAGAILDQFTESGIRCAASSGQAQGGTHVLGDDDAKQPSAKKTRTSTHRALDDSCLDRIPDRPGLPGHLVYMGRFEGDRLRHHFDFFDVSDDDDDDEKDGTFIVRDDPHDSSDEEERQPAPVAPSVFPLPTSTCNCAPGSRCRLDIDDIIKCRWWGSAGTGRFGELFFFGNPDAFRAYYKLVCVHFNVSDLNELHINTPTSRASMRRATSFTVVSWCTACVWMLRCMSV